MFLFAAAPVFSQNAIREQGLVTTEPFWRQALGGTIIALPHVQAQSAVVALDSGNIRAFSTTGTPMWNFSARGRISPFVTRSREGSSYFSRTNGTLMALNRSGREIWRRNIGGPLCAAVVTGWDSRLFVPTEKKISCYTASGNLLWTRTFESPLSLSPKLDHNGGIIFALDNNEVIRIDAFGNISNWPPSGKIAVLLSVDKQQILALYTDGTMGMLESSKEWFFTAQADEHPALQIKLPSSPVAAVSRGSSVAVVTSDGSISLLSLEEKKILWTGDSHIREYIKSGGRPDPDAEIIFDERGIYIISKNGAAGFSHEGKRLWFTLLHNAAAMPAFGDDGVLYSGGKDWILYAYRIEDRVIRERGGIYGPVSGGSYETVQSRSSFILDYPVFNSEIKPVLDQISSALGAGRVGSNEPAWTSFLKAVAAGQYPLVQRAGAIRLLGQLGSLETIPFLTNVFKNENESSIKSAAALAIGAIGVDPQGVAIRAFIDYAALTTTVRDNQVLVAIAAATGALCRFSGPPLSETGVKILTILSSGDQQQIVSRQAKKELASLR
ncbi:MAG: PQQ-binding-like beta-propeller repeat protein [Treponema sp.]|nr:PQQ-binding-like beta-propeller repeat protein [Treponema sp.]